MTTFNIYLPTKNGKIGVELKHILYFESLGDTNFMVLNNDEKIELLMAVDEIEQLLCYRGFFRFTQNYLVNLKAVQLIFPGDASKVVLENGKEIFAPQSRREELFRELEKVYQVHATI
ncbi:MAG: hypothetical protein A2X13_13675 [Bacteroidetes bacterium GWC2_33_15]|nr:MAG: hypothetical protein A2X10_08890 [Bacteroidetes bacterium GWA2_33_15]OFX50397.1 MAG: hypothetical protein A2X13_13675 [Bacteroidetes bacterium GWC2_33_15]OFX66685.1 MAG: hypothetical protein A2X15_08200 [Bacteroidetes bacterium GWB2_32_14]OFX69303.1 MAG: hypothetical protein A2X14_09130 [Bacteroidetes bacterium GWD2_33_33]HAN18619.1 hypothetical protein [Bacteroidales bacterium]